jgi:hypothetical protein
MWILVFGKVPSWIVGSKDYVITGLNARIVGFVLMLPLPVSMVGGIVIGLLFGSDAVAYAFFLEVAVFILDLIVALILLRRFRKPAPSTTSRQP